MVYSENCVWVFNGNSRKFPGAVFKCKEAAFEWVRKNELSGILTCYPLDTGVYEWAIMNKFFAPTKDEHFEPDFIGGFTSASQDHVHFENGEVD